MEKPKLHFVLFLVRVPFFYFHQLRNEKPRYMLEGGRRICKNVDVDSEENRKTISHLRIYLKP